jgi:hypothetical protein
MEEVVKEITGKQRRKRSPRPKKTKRTNPATSARLKEMWKDPAFRENMRIKMEPVIAYRKAHPEKFSRRGVPDGMRKPEADRLWAVARDKAKKAIKIMEDEGHLPAIVIPDSDDDKAKRVLEEMFAITLSPLTHQPTKIAAGRTVLEWCRSKPVQKTAVAISNAEDWLNSVVSDNKASDDQLKRIEGSTTSVPD